MSKQIDTVDALVANVGPFLSSLNPLGEMSKAGYTFGGDVGTALKRAPVRTKSTEVFNDLIAEHGPPPPMQLHVGRKQPAIAPLVKPGQNQVRASVDLDVLNQVLAAFWEGDQIPQHIGPDQLSQLKIEFSDLEDQCVGIPTDAQGLQGLDITTPPAFSAGQVSTSAHLTAGIRLNVQGPTPAAFICTLEVEIPLVFAVTASIWFDNSAFDNASVQLTIDPASKIVPKSTAAKVKMAAIFQQALSILGPFVGSELAISVFREGIALGQFKAVTRPGGKSGFVTAGTSVAGEPDASSANLLSEPVPAQGQNFHLAADQSFATAILTAAIKDGSLAQDINQSQPPGTPQLVVHSGSVSFDAGQIIARLDITAIDACGPKDVDMTVTVSGKAGVSSGGLALLQPTVDVDLDDVDAVICALSGLLGGPFGLLITTYLVLTVNPKVGDQTLSGVSLFLPGSEKDFNLQFTKAITDATGTLVADGNGSVDPDTTQSFIYLQIVSGPVPRFAPPVAGASVELLELDNPPPAGDDVQVKLHPRPGYQLTYKPTPDQSLGKAVTDANGVVRFAVVPNMIAGIETETKNTEDTRTGKIVKVVTGLQDIEELKPDFGVNITGPDGKALAQRLLVALNVADRHVGSFNKPLVVNVNEIVAAPEKA